MKLLILLNLLLCSFALYSQSENRSYEKIRVKKISPPYKKNIFAVSLGAGKFTSDIFGISQNDQLLPMQTRTFKYTRRFLPQFGMTLYATRSQTSDYKFDSEKVKTRLLFLAFKISSSTQSPFQFFFSPGFGIGLYPTYIHPYISNPFGFDVQDFSKVERDDFDQSYFDWGGEMGFEYHFAKHFILSFTSQAIFHIGLQGQYSFSGGIGVKF